MSEFEYALNTVAKVGVAEQLVCIIRIVVVVVVRSSVRSAERAVRLALHLLVHSLKGHQRLGERRFGSSRSRQADVATDRARPHARIAARVAQLRVIGK